MPTATLNPPLADKARWRQAVLHQVTYSLGLTVEQLSAREAFVAVALAVRDRMVEQWLATQQRYQQADAKGLYYLSLEFLIGRSLHSNLVNLGLLETCHAVLKDLGFDPTEVEASEIDAALGNGGLGRLAACFLDSLATMGLPGFGYGIDYDFGLFKQEVRNGQQV